MFWGSVGSLRPSSRDLCLALFDLNTCLRSLVTPKLDELGKYLGKMPWVFLFLIPLARDL